jgi:hypothetical protein
MKPRPKCSLLFCQLRQGRNVVFLGRLYRNIERREFWCLVTITIRILCFAKLDQQRVDHCRSLIDLLILLGDLLEHLVVVLASLKKGILLLLECRATGGKVFGHVRLNV